jgi:hypothetical protein
MPHYICYFLLSATGTHGVCRRYVCTQVNGANYYGQLARPSTAAAVDCRLPHHVGVRSSVLRGALVGVPFPRLAPRVECAKSCIGQSSVAMEADAERGLDGHSLRHPVAVQ